VFDCVREYRESHVCRMLAVFVVTSNLMGTFQITFKV
jgi:hypothetical protein